MTSRMIQQIVYRSRYRIKDTKRSEPDLTLEYEDGTKEKYKGKDFGVHFGKMAPEEREKFAAAIAAYQDGLDISNGLSFEADTAPKKDYDMKRVSIDFIVKKYGKGSKSKDSIIPPNPGFEDNTLEIGL
jgi:hypothetical protein